MGSKMRWLTVSSQDQPDLEFTLLPIAEGMIVTKETTNPKRILMKSGTFADGVLNARIFILHMKN
jgi:hypothetical protein